MDKWIIDEESKIISRASLILAGLVLLLPAIFACGPSRYQVERDNLIAEHKIHYEEWAKEGDALRAEAARINREEGAFRRGLSNAQVEKILLCEKYNNHQSCDAFYDTLDSEQKEMVRQSRFRKDKWLLRYEAFQRWSRLLADSERRINNLLAMERENRAAMAQMIGAWSISNQLMLMNNTLNSMQGTMLFNRPLR